MLFPGPAFRIQTVDGNNATEIEFAPSGMGIDLLTLLCCLCIRGKASEEAVRITINITSTSYIGV